MRSFFDTVIEHWNADNLIPPRLDKYCDEVSTSTEWQASYETMTGKAIDKVKERSRCLAVAAGLQDMVRSGCELPSCNPSTACATFC